MTTGWSVRSAGCPACICDSYNSSGMHHAQQRSRSAARIYRSLQMMPPEAKRTPA